MDLRAASTNLKKDIDKAMGRTSKQLKQAGKDISKLMAVSLTAASASIVAATKKGLTAVDNLAKTSDRLGIATESLQAFRHAADLTGASSEVLDMGLQRMTRRIAEAAQGTGEARNAIRELGLEASRLNSLGAEEQFLAIADAMKEVENASDRVRLTQKLFDSEGVKLVNTLEMGREGIEAARMELDQLGVSISRIDAVKVERANDAMAKLGQAFAGISNRLAVEFAPFIEAASNKLLDLAKSGNAVGKAVASSIDFVGGIAVAIDNVVYSVQVAVGLIGSAIGALGGSILTVVEGFRKLFSGVAAVAKVVFDNFGTLAKRGFLKAKEAVVEFAGFLVDKLRTANLEILETFQSVADAVGLPFDTDAARIKINEQTLTAKKWLSKMRGEIAGELAETQAEFGKVEFLIGEAWRNATSKSTEGAIAFWRDTLKAFGEDQFRELEELISKGLPGMRILDKIQEIKADMEVGLDQMASDIQSTAKNIPAIDIPLQFSFDESIKDIQNAPTQALQAFRRQFDLLSIQLKENVIGLDQFTESVDRMKAMVREAEQVFNSTRTNSEMYQAEIARLIQLYEEGVISQETFNRAIANTAMEFDLTEKPVKRITDATNRYNEAVNKLREQLKTGAINQEEFQKSLETVGKGYQQEIDKINSRIQTIQEQWYAVNRNIERSIDDLVETGKFSFKGMVNSIIKDLAKIQLRKALIGDGLGMGGSGGLLGSIFKGFKSILPGFASGGRPFVGAPNIVGEKGPEIFVPDVRGTILSHEQSKRFMAKMESPAVQMPSGPSARQTRVIEKAAGDQKMTQISLYQTNHIESGVQAPQVAEMLNEHGKELITNFIDLVQRGGTVTQVFQQ